MFTLFFYKNFYETNIFWFLNASILFIIQFLLNTSSFPNTVIITWWELMENLLHFDE